MGELQKKVQNELHRARERAESRANAPSAEKELSEAQRNALFLQTWICGVEEAVTVLAEEVERLRAVVEKDPAITDDRG